MRKKVFLYWQFQILELKKDFCFKKGFFIANFRFEM